MPVSSMAEFHGQHVPNPSLTLLVQQVLALGKGTLLELGHVYGLALGHLHRVALKFQLNIFAGIWFCVTSGNH